MQQAKQISTIINAQFISDELKKNLQANSYFLCL